MLSLAQQASQGCHPNRLTVPPAEAATKEVAARLARRVDVGDMQPIDLVICGSVAVNHRGVRLGKGSGYSDIEVALLAEAGLLSDRTTIVTAVHELQVLDDELQRQIMTFAWISS
jgi:5-formyltetrahydrofolate cyclo-ligase